MILCMNLASGYGIFGGNSTRWARACGVPRSVLSPQSSALRRSAAVQARGDSRLSLSVPSPQSCALYCQHGSRVEVLAPKGLRKSVGQVLAATAEMYR
jgi:hypothetical protein